MAIAKRKSAPSAFAPIGRPVSKTLMGNQDTLHKGDSTNAATVPTTFRCPKDLKEEAREYAERTGIPVTRLIIEGLEWRLRR
jgi:ribosomal protein L30E